MPNDEIGNSRIGGWAEWSQYVRIGISEIKSKQDELQREIGRVELESKQESNKIKIEMGMMKVKLTIWGSIGVILATGLLNWGLSLLKAVGGP